MGLWLIQQCKSQWNKDGSEVSFSQLEKEAREANAFKCFIDPDDILFVKPGDFPERIRNFCKATDQYVPQTRGEIVRCIYESLALKHRETFEQIIEVSKMEYDRIFIVGGGAKDKMLCQLTANACSTEVVAGPVEATALGNISVQLISQGAIRDVNEARCIIADSFPGVHYKPENKENWDKAYNKFKKIILRREEI
ncbi:MAG TPA: FGGY-family carbohydrate kinase, partial [Ruminiclostridium sp.]|nr:FGGY-family carbohydrate kinase [Ruminiclostridium sp.]